ERANIIAALGQANSRISGKGGAADLLGISASTLASRIKSLGIECVRYAKTIWPIARSFEVLEDLRSEAQLCPVRGALRRAFRARCERRRAEASYLLWD